MIAIKRIYETACGQDGYRVLVDRVWPRGMSKEKANVDDWLKEAGPSSSLRKWFNHDPKKWDAFREKYKAELKEKSALLNDLKAREHQYEKISLLYSARDQTHNQAVVLKEVLDATDHLKHRA